MPLEAPQLDTRTWAELVAEARRRIPRYTPEWTDLNDSDPGITLVQLFAWLTEMTLYQMNRVPERNYIEFLNLLNLEPRPAQAAVAWLSFSPGSGYEGQSIPQGTEILAEAALEDGSPILFETDHALDLVRLPLVRVASEVRGRFTDMTEANDSAGGFYYPFGRLPQPGNALYLGFGPEGGEAANGEVGEAGVPGEGGFVPPASPFPRRMNVRIILAPVAESQPVAPGLGLAWEVAVEDGWRQVTVVEDGSRAFTRTGNVVLKGPALTRAVERTLPQGSGSAVSGAVSGDTSSDTSGDTSGELYWLRCRVASGSPPLRPDGTRQVPRLDTAAPNTVRALSLVTVVDEVLGESDGLANQLYTLEHTPVHRGSLDLWVEDPEGEASRWLPIEDLFAAGPEDDVYSLDLSTGRIRFGDGRHGRIPPAGAVLVARRYRYGGGAATNVGTGLINTPLDLAADVTVTNWRPAVGGSDEESVEEVAQRAPLALRNKNRAVTAEDYAALATEVGGVAQAVALPLYNPDFPDVEVPGAVSVVIVPESEETPPAPSAELLDEVRLRLERRRMLTTELYVLGPRFQYLRAEIKVLIDPTSVPDEVREGVQEALEELLSPEQQRIGQALYPGQIYRTVLEVPGVREILRLELYVDGEAHRSMERPIRLPRDGFLVSDRHLVEVETRAGHSTSADVSGWQGGTS